MQKKIIDISAKSWRSVLDFYDSILKEVQAPEWHGESVDALVDSVVYGGINGLEPPYTIRIHEAVGIPIGVLKEIQVAKQAIERARLNRLKTEGVDAGVDIEMIGDLA